MWDTVQAMKKDHDEKIVIVVFFGMFACLFVSQLLRKVTLQISRKDAFFAF